MSPTQVPNTWLKWEMMLLTRQNSPDRASDSTRAAASAAQARMADAMVALALRPSSAATAPSVPETAMPAASMQAKEGALRHAAA